MAKEIVVVIDKQGRARHLVDEPSPALTSLLGDVEDIYRNSHVEPTSELSDTAVRDRAKWLSESLWKDYDQQIGYSVEELRNKLPQNRWWADLTPLPDGPVLGPFDTRDEALAAEIQWLKENHLPAKKDA